LVITDILQGMAQTQEPQLSTEQVDVRLYQQLLEAVRHIDALVQQGENVHAVEPGSALAGDDSATAPFQLSHAARLAISVSSDHLAALRALAIEGSPDAGLQMTTRPYAAYPLLRASLESTLAALWLLRPANRTERVARRLAWYYSHQVQKGEYLKAAGRVKVPDEEIFAAIAPVAAKRNISRRRIKKAYGGFGNLAQLVSQEWPGRDPELHLAWRALSGATHGDIWAILTLSEYDLPEGMGPGDVHTGRMTMSMVDLIRWIVLTEGYLRCAVNLFEERRTSAP
jgi:hypothetical protein